MPKTRDIPSELKAFNKVFESLSYRYNDSQVFNDFLELVINGFATANSLSNPIKKSVIANYSDKEQGLFDQLFRELIMLYDSKIQEDNDWYDALGHFYEALASTSRKQGFGQFFTPEPVVDFMTELVYEPSNKVGNGMYVSDPCCGSGRMLLSFHAKAPGNFTMAGDLDRTCAMMCVVNFLFHGCVGEVVWADGLNPDSFYGAWRVNEYLNGCFPFPHCRPIEKEETWHWKSWQQRLEKFEIQKDEEPQVQVRPEPIKPTKTELKKAQLTLF